MALTNWSIRSRRGASYGGLGFTVIAPTCVIADAMTKVVRLSPESALDILKTFDAQAVKIDHHGASFLQTVTQEI